MLATGLSWNRSLPDSEAVEDVFWLTLDAFYFPYSGKESGAHERFVHVSV